MSTPARTPGAVIASSFAVGHPLRLLPSICSGWPGGKPTMSMLLSTV